MASITLARGLISTMPHEVHDGRGDLVDLVAARADPHAVGGGLGVVARALRPQLDRVDRAVAQDVPAEVEQAAVGLAGPRAHAASGSLRPQHRRHGRAHERDQVDVAGVEAGGEHVAIDQRAQLAGAEAGDGVGAFFGRASRR